MIYEIRDYHYRPELFDDYKIWAEDAVPVLRAHMDVQGFWIDSGATPEITGTSPIDTPIGSANVTWIIRWSSRKAREVGMRSLLDNPDWRAVWAKHPDPNGYLQMSARFMQAM